VSDKRIDERVQELLDTLQLAVDRKRYRHKDFFLPYEKQIVFCDLGLSKRERLLMAGNQTGKTEIGAFECACHLTGEYPDWWLGKRWDRPVKAWAAGITGLSTRDVVQKKLCGEPGVESAFGTGMIPRECFVGKPSTARGVADLFDKIVVKHKSGGDSVLILKTYEQGRQKWQGDTLDFVWFDEEPEEEIYSEGLARLAGDGLAYMTFTPLLGMSDVVMSFVENDEHGNPHCEKPDKGLVMMTLDDVTHFTPEEKAKRISGYKDYEREARAKGIPILGGGRIFQVTEERIVEDALSYYPEHWTWLWGLDFGIDHPFAAVLIAWDKDADVIHIAHAIRMKDASILQHAAAMKPFGWIKVAWPQDGTQRDRGDLKPMSDHYKRAGVRMLPEHATFSDGSNSTEAGVTEMDERFKTGRLKVARHLTEWFEEFRLYHRKDGLIVKIRDDLMSATRVAIMAKRKASVRQPMPDNRGGSGPQMAIGVDDDPWG
jgi:phage terminase large subunit-like protein